MTMHVLADGQRLHYTLPEGVPLAVDPESIVERWRRPTSTLIDYDDEHTRDHGDLMRVIRRVGAGEELWVHGDWSAFKSGRWASMLGYAVHDQVRLMQPLTWKFQCSDVEMMDAIDQNRARVVSVDFQNRCNVMVDGRADRNREQIGWATRAAVCAWLLDERHVASHPITHALGYRGSVVERMEPHGRYHYPHGDPQNIDAERSVTAFVRHMDVAVKLALDTPQPVTLDLTPGTLTVENVRITSQLRGLLITLPTGGTLFYRDAHLDRSTGKVMIEGKPAPIRRIPMDVFYEATLNMYHWDMVYLHFSDHGALPTVMQQFKDWRRRTGVGLAQIALP